MTIGGLQVLYCGQQQAEWLNDLNSPESYAPGFNLKLLVSSLRSQDGKLLERINY